MRIILLLLGIFIAPLAAGDVYRSVDESGNVVFTDKPSPDAEKVEIDEVQTIDRGATPEFNYTPPPSEAQSPYSSVAITSPANDETLSSNDGNVSVSVSVEPRLRPGHIVVLYMDGSSVAEGAGSFNLTNLDRGTHTLTAVVKAGGNEVIKSAPVSFTVQRHSKQHPKSTVGKPPPPPKTP